MEQPAAESYQEHRKEAIKAAAEVFAEKGYHGASTKDIAAQMGIKQGSLYYYFKSKEEALMEVCLLGIGDYVKRMQEITASSQSFEAKLRATVVAHLSGYREKNVALKVYNDERLYLQKDKRSKLKELGSGYRQQLETIFEAGKSAGQVRQNLDCHFAAQSVIGLCNSWGHWVVRDHDMNLFDVAQRCSDLLLHGCALNEQQQH